MPDGGTRLIAATADPAALKAESTWFMAANLRVAEADAAGVYQIYRLRDWIEHYYKPAKHELGWADFQVRSGCAPGRACSCTGTAGQPPRPRPNWRRCLSMWVTPAR